MKMLKRLFEMAKEGLNSDYCDFEEEEYLLLKKEIIGEEFYYKVYPMRFFKSKDEAKRNYLDLDYDSSRPSPYPIEAISKKEKKKQIREFKMFGYHMKYCPRCGYLECDDFAYCVKCIRKDEKEVRLVNPTR